MNKIKLVLLTGFLGAGKTTLMQSILTAYSDHKIGVIVNEFGEVNIDAVLIRRHGITMAELSNGSIFCACIKQNFLASLIEMSAKDLDYIFIEASGLADPANMTQILDSISSKTIKSYDYLGALCVIDGENFLMLYEMLPALEHQVEYSSSAIINKADLVTEDILEEISTVINRLNPAAHVFITSYCRVDIKAVIDGLTPVTREATETTNTFESRPKTFILTAEESLSSVELTDFLNEIAGDCYRIKGFSETDDGNIEISAVGVHVNCTVWPEKIAGTKIIAISAVGIKLMSSISKALENRFEGKLHF